MISSPSRIENATPSITARVMCARPWRTVRPTNAPRACGSRCGVRSPVRYGRNSRPSAPGSTASASSTSSSKLAPPPSRSRHHDSEPPADSVTAIRWNAPGTAWQNACTRPEASGVNSSRCANSTPLVPIEVETDPSCTTPTPTAAAALSPPPAATGSPRGSPSSSATSSRTVPVASGPSYTRGSHDRGISSAARISSDQSRARTSSSSVPAASDASVARSPVSSNRT